ncbi:MAG: hypothetical protein IIA45_02080 [Bacteroidetes bacterium]|nr:hypothetical protein [Bacteroidota bacterium]
MDYIIQAYLIYLPLSVLITFWVGRTLFKNGRRFIFDIMNQNAPLTNSVNTLMVVGFYLVNMGFAVFTLKIAGDLDNYRMLIEALSFKVGLVIVFVGGMHFFYLYLFFRQRHKIKEEKG